jgi:hypothetical protein
VNVDNVSIYLDGKDIKLFNDGDASSEVNLSANANFRIGSIISNGSYAHGSIANFRLYSKALNADQVRELYEYDAERFGHRQNLVALHKGNLGVGVPNPTSRFEVAGADGLQEYPPKAMTGYETYMEGHGVFRASASSTFGNYYVYRIFNKANPVGGNSGAGAGWASQGPSSETDTYNSTTGLESLSTTHHTGSVQGEWVQFETSNPIKLKTLDIHSRSETNYTGNMTGFPKNVYLYGSNDNANWTLIKNFTTVSKTLGTSHLENINATQAYKNYAFVINSIHVSGTDVGFTSIGQMYFNGTPAPSALEDGHLTLGKALTLPRVSGHPAGAETPRAESLVVHYDTTVDSVVSGSTVVDISGEGNNGTLVNGTTYNSTNRCLHGDGPSAGHHTNTPITLTGGAMSLSIGMWFRAETLAPSASDYRVLSLVGTKATGQAFIVSYSSTHLIQDWYGKDFRSSKTLQSNTWYHVVSTYNGGNIQSGSSKIYINGVELPGSTAYTGALSLPTAQTSLELFDYINGSNDRHHGDISNFKLWNVALTAEEVAAEYTLGRTGKSINLTDTALCLGGTVPRAQLDVRGNILYSGNLTSTALPTMWDHMRAGRHGSGIYPIKGKQGGSKVYNVYCEPDIFGGGWMCFTQIPQAGIGIAYNTINLYSFDSGDSSQLRRDKFFNVPYNILSNTNGVDCDILVLLYGAGLRYNMQGAKLGAIWRGVDLTKAFDSTLPTGTTITANAAQATSADGITFTSQSFELISAIGWEISIASASGNTGAYNDYNDGTGGFIIHQNGTSAFSVYGGIRGPAGTWQYNSNTDFKIARIFVRPSQF